MKRGKRYSFWRAARRSAPLRWSLLAVAIFALGFQSFVIKPHIHLQTESTLYAALTLDSVNADVSWDSAEERAEALHAALKYGGHPLQHDSSDCYLCQTAHQSGQFLPPGAAVHAAPPHANVRVIETTLVASPARAVSFAWQGRAPPAI
jgi:hypothetical protein